MTSLTPKKNILEECAEKFAGARKNALQGIALLWKIREEGLFRETHQSFGAFAEEECGLNASQASRYLTAFEHFSIQGGFSIAQIGEVDVEKLYIAKSLSGSAEEQLAKAQSLSIRELKAQNVYEKTGEECAHEKTYTACCSCNKRIDNENRPPQT